MRPDSISSRITEYDESIGAHRAGTINPPVLQMLEDLLPRPLNWSMETGCGKSTILLSHFSLNHLVFTYDDRSEAHSSVAYFAECPLFRPEHVTTVFGSTQATLPRFQFGEPIDLAFLDGPHAYPFPELEYFYVYPHLRPGGLLVIDDIHIPTIHRLHTFLREDSMFELICVEMTTAFFRRTSAPTFFPLGDGWEHQRFNITRFPVDVSSGQSSAAADDLRDLQAGILEARREIDWLRYVANERRLKRRLARLLGPLGNLPFFR